MSDAQHTPEPWEVGRNGWQVYPRPELPGTIAAADERKQPSEQVANAERIVACVNALAGIDDPETALRELREACECVVATAWGNTDGLTEAEQLQALRSAASVARDALAHFGHTGGSNAD